MQVIEYQLPDKIRSLCGEQTQLQSDEGYRQISPHGHAQDLSGIGTKARRNIHRSNWQTAGIDGSDDAGVRFTYLTRQTRPQQRVQHDTAQGCVGGPGLDIHPGRQSLRVGQRGIALQPLRISGRQHLYPPTGTQGQCRDQIAVARIIAMSCHNAEFTRIRPPSDNGSPHCPRGTLHQFEAWYTRRNQAGIQIANLSGAIQRVG